MNKGERRDKLRFKVPGYKESDKLDVLTTGLAGSFSLERELNINPQKQQKDNKIEFGI